MKKKILIILLLIIIAGVSVIILWSNINKKNESRYIKLSIAAKMLTLLDTDRDNLDGESKENWDFKYIQYMDKKGYIDGSKRGERFFSYTDLKKYLEQKEIRQDDIADATGVDISEHKSGEKIAIGDFIKIYDYLVAIDETKKGVHEEDLIIVSTPANNDNAKPWQAYTTAGAYFFEGLNLDCYIDCSIRAYVRGDELVYVKMKLSEEVTYKNVWLERGNDRSITAYIGSYKRVFNTKRLECDFSETVGDIHMKNGQVCGVSLKRNRIDGRILMVDDKKVELEGYGTLEFDDEFHIYKTYGVIQNSGIEDLLVGYNIADFVVAGDKICAAVITKNLSADNIRVLIMATGFTSLFHERATITSEGSFTVSYGKKKDTYGPGEIVDIYKNSKELKKGRVVIETVNDNEKLQLLNVQKAQGNPCYRGRIEVVAYDEGLVIVNEVPIEEYLYAVVPSEMPNRFGVEALKVQAVCARSYAYRQLLNNSYAKYGAHVDDSVNFQVYNNVNEQEDSTEAVRETYGEVLAYNGETITTYYYSTSCGHTSDNSVWGGSPDACPYLTAKNVNSQHNATDLSSEEAFSDYIKSENESDYDYGFGYYRWKVRLSLDEITESVNEYIYSRYCANPSQIKVYEDGKWVKKEIRNVGKVTSISIESRSTGGAVTSLIIYGTKAKVKVENELNIRYLLCPRDNPITLFKGDTTTFYIMPSAYFILDGYEKDGELAGYNILGGGYGHGIGMSQNAVSNMVKDGMKYDDILEYFFEGTDIKNVYQ